MLKWFATFTLAICGLSTHWSEASTIYVTDPFSTVDSNGLSPFWHWNTLETENFRVTFPDGLKEVANKSANYLEEAHSFLSPLLQWEPHYKPQILVIDNIDAANGLTSPVARYGIILWATPPDNWFGTYYYDDWLRLLVIHEYAHFLNMDTTEDFWKVLRPIFGDTFLPNSAWAPWMLEGLAVYMETRFTRAGRGRSPYYDMVLRAAVEDGTLNTSNFMTLNRITGTNPYFPGGDTRYIFGYNLMNQISQQHLSQGSGDEKESEPHRHNDEILGIMSKRSGGRIPFLINSNLKNIIGKDWYDSWDEWVKETQIRSQAQLDKIKSQPVTQYTVLTEKEHTVSNEVAGVAASPNGKWLAYSDASADKRPGLYLRNLETGESHKVLDKIYGVGLKFTPDSKAVLYSRLHRVNNYYLFSDLEIYNLETGSAHWLTDNLRARDPDISKDGKWVVFTITEKAVTGIAIAPLTVQGDDYELGPVQKLYMPPLYDHLANPRFSLDDRKILFSNHPIGKSQEDILEFDRETQAISTIISDGYYNRFPILNDSGELFFVSNKTGVDNLYHYNWNLKSSALVTNITTGISFPNFGPQLVGDSSYPLYASVFSSAGWDLAQIVLSPQNIPPESVTVSSPPAPEPGPHSSFDNRDARYEEDDYSIFPSILPRIWSPLLGLDASGVIVGGEIFGFDATNRHRYILAGSYASQLQVGDWYGLYSNRSWGFTFNLSADLLTKYVDASSTSASYSRQADLAFSLAYPFLETYSTFVPMIGVSLSRLFNYQTGQDFANASLIGASSFVPTVDGVLSFSNLETAPLALVPEGGRSMILGTRLYYLNSNQQIWKGLFIDQEYFRLGKHTVLNPSFKASMSSQLSTTYRASNSILQGRIPQELLGAFSGDSFNVFSIRGYPSYSYFAKAAATAAIDLTFPLARIFSGWGTNPLFLDNLYGFAFAEASYLPFSTTNFLLPSMGTGVRFSLEVFTLPLTLSTEFHQGFRGNLGGTSDIFFQALMGAVNF